MRENALVPAAGCLLLFIVGLAGCSDSKETEDGHLIYPDQIDEIMDTELHDRAIARKAMEYIRLSEDYTPETFEAQQREAIAQMTPDFRNQAISKSISLDEYSAVLGKRRWGDQVRASLRIESDNVMTIDGEPHRNRMEYVLNILIYNLDDFEYQTLGSKPAD